MEFFKGRVSELFNQLFQNLLISYLLLLLAEQIWAKSVSTYMNMNYILIIVIIFGILDSFSKHKKTKEEKPKRWDYVFISALGIIGLIIIKYKTFELGWLSWVISIIAGVLIILLSLLILEEDEEAKKTNRHKIK